MGGGSRMVGWGGGSRWGNLGGVGAYAPKTKRWSIAGSPYLPLPSLHSLPENYNRQKLQAVKIILV